MTHYQQPQNYSQPQPNTAPGKPKKERKRYGLGALVGTGVASAVLTFAVVVGGSLWVAETDRELEYRDGTYDWFRALGAKAVLEDTDTFNEAALISCNAMADNPAIELPQQRNVAEKELQKAFPHLSDDDATALFIAAGTTGCPHLLGGVGVTLLKVLLEGRAGE